MNYIFDTSAFVNLFRHYFPERFPTLWRNFDSLVSTKQIVSTREVRKEIELIEKKDRLANWAKKHLEIFPVPSVEELKFVQGIFAVPHFQNLLRKQETLQGKPLTPL